MPTTFRPYQPDQSLLLAPSLREWLPEGHLADHVSDLVEGLDLTAFYAPYEGDGRRKSPYEPRMMLKVLIYGYAALGREGRRDVGVDAEKCPAKARMAAKLETDAGREQYAERKWLSEAPNGWIKEALGFRRFGVRGLDKVRGEWDLVCLALNVKRLQWLQTA